MVVIFLSCSDEEADDDDVGVDEEGDDVDDDDDDCAQHRKTDALEECTRRRELLTIEEARWWSPSPRFDPEAKDAEDDADDVKRRAKPPLPKAMKRPAPPAAPCFFIREGWEAVLTSSKPKPPDAAPTCASVFVCSKLAKFSLRALRRTTSEKKARERVRVWRSLLRDGITSSTNERKKRSGNSKVQCRKPRPRKKSD